MELSETIKTFREQAGFSMRELAAKANLSPEYISCIESGKTSNVGIEKLRSLADALSISIHALIDPTYPQPSIAPATEDVKEVRHDTL